VTVRWCRRERPPSQRQPSCTNWVAPRAVRRVPAALAQKSQKCKFAAELPTFSCSRSFVSYALPLGEQTTCAQPQTFTMADNGSSNRDGKRKWDNTGDRRRGRGGSMQHGSRANKKRNMGRKEHA
jgi:hypothetical protein